MNRLRKLFSLLLSLAIVASLSTAALATDTGNQGQVAPVLWDASKTYDWYTALAQTTERSTGKAETAFYTMDIKANVAKLTITNDGVKELDVAINGQHLKLNDLFAPTGTGEFALDISSLVTYGANAVAIQSLGKPGATATIKVEAPKFTARILNTNDIHAAIDPLPKMAAYIKAAKAQGGNVFFVDAGDNFSGNPVSDLNHGVPMIESLNQMTVDAFAVGNHDFDHGPANTQALRELSNFEWLSANTFVADQSLTPIQPFKAYEIHTNELGQKIAFIGLTQDPPATGVKNQVGLRFEDPAVHAQQLIAELRDQVNLLVIVSHNGIDWDIANAPAMSGADLIISAHSHTYLSKPTVAAGIPIMQVGSSAANIGDLVLTQTDTVALTPGAAGGKWAVATKDMTAVDADVQATVTKWNEQMAPILATKIGTNVRTLDADGGKTANDSGLGNLIADSLRDAMQADMGIWNNGGIRADLPAGDITMNSIYKVLPFGNVPWKATVTGAEVIDLLTRSFAKRNSIDLQISGASYTVFTKPDGSLDYLDVKVAGQPLVLDQTYTMALSDYVATTPQYWTTLPTIVDMSSEVDAIAMANFVTKLGTVDYKTTEGRIKIKTSPTPIPVTSVNFYSTASLLADESGALVPLTNQADVLVSAESTAYQIDNSGGDYAPKNFEHVDAGQPLPLAAIQNVGSGKVFGMGAILLANGYQTGWQHAQWFTNVLDYLNGSKTGTLLVDAGHGQYYGKSRFTQLTSFLADRGWTMNFTNTNTRITSAGLVGVKVFMITTPDVVGAYTADELTVLKSWVAGGGKLILASQSDFGGNANATEMNNIAAGVGTVIRFNSDQVSDNTNNARGANYSPVTNEFNPAYPELLKAR
ncbi:MAG TPA: bifunctional UDP-sugar hydrolase/5'-nucleotidase [Symbiobacteriaceae bacterium]|nr:bifunctional UDP-sugar hydrolase/5'-nucleotidase [Symbiobacteriaceae bacterium]